MRKSGILMHITSLPGAYGIGTMGKNAYEFVDFLHAAGQSYWQILPVNPTGYGDSPYQALSAVAGNPYLLDLDVLKEEGLLTQAELDAVDWGDDPCRVDFGAMYQSRRGILEKAFRRFRPQADYRAFLEENASWLENYSLFAALKAANDNKPWTAWPREYKFRYPEAMVQARDRYAQAVELECFLQYQFHKQWQRLRGYANEKGIRIIGDVPIYVPLDSADVWAQPELFLLDENLSPVQVAGCPPDSFSRDGQRWGNPLYNWKKLAQTGYDWWIRRLGAAQKLYDVVRIDHFRGFESYWSIPAQDDTAKNGCWLPGPGMDFINAIQKALPGLSCIAEDLGYVTPQVRQLQEQSGYPGMKVLQFGFDSREESNYLPHLYPADSVCYTGTHDNMPLAQWLENASADDADHARRYLGLSREEGYVRGLIRGAMSSVSRLCVVQLQDYLELGEEARMNEPGVLSEKNWTWRAPAGFATEELSQRIARITALYGRK